MPRIPAKSFTIVSKVLSNSKQSKNIYEKILGSLSSGNQEEITSIGIEASAAIVSLIENSDYKRTIIDKHNEAIQNIYEQDSRDKVAIKEKLPFLKSEISSKTSAQEYIIKDDLNNGKSKLVNKVEQMLQQSKNTDVVTTKFKEYFDKIKDNNINPEEIFMFNAQNYNRLAHRLGEEIDSIRGGMDFSDREKKLGEYSSILDRAHNLCINNTDSSDYNFNYKTLKEYIDELNKEGKNLVPSLNIETQKAERLIRAVLPSQKNIDKEFMMNFCKTLKLKESMDLFFDYKEMSCRSLLLYQDKVKKQCAEKNVDPYESGNLKYRVTYIDEEKSLTNGNKSYRIHAGLHKAFEKCAKFVDFVVPGRAFQQQLADKNRVFETNTIKDAIRDEMKKTGRKYIGETEIYAFLSEENSMIMHINRDETDKFLAKKNIKIEEEKNPFVEQIAFKSIPFGAGRKNPKRNKMLEPLANNCIANEKEYNGEYELFEEKNSFSNMVEKQFKNKEEI